MKVVRVALPGYNAETDTNLDHYSLYADVDNVLIKRALTGSGTVPVAGGPGYTTDTIAHNLGYIPFFTVNAHFTDFTMGDTWKLLNNISNVFSVPEAICAADATNLYVTNFQGVTLPYSYDIFYDDMDQTGAPSITESKNLFKVARPGKSALSKNPNDYIMHSDLNNFKILKQALVTSHSLSSGDNTIAHGVTLVSPYKMFCFIKFPDGKVLQTGYAAGYAYDESKFVETSLDATNIHIRASGAVTVDIAYFIYGSGADNTITKTSPLIMVAKSGKNVKTETNPDNYNFHSNYNTLKYYLSGTWDMGTITAGTVKTIAHNLGYTPFFIGFVRDISNFYSTTAYAISPYYQGNLGANKDIAGFVYADSTNIYLKAYYQSSAGGTSRSFKFYYKLFKNNLGL